MNHAVLAFIQSDVLAYFGIASLILWKQGTETTPTTQVAPSKLGGKSEDVFRLLHYGVVDAYLFAGGEESAYHFFLLVGVEGIGHLIHDGGKVGLEGADGSADGVDVPHEDASIPVVVAGDKVLLGCLMVWLFLEGFHLIYLVNVRGLGSGDVAVAGLGATGLDADGDDDFLVCSIAECLAEDTLVFRGVDDQSIGWSHHDVGFRMLLLNLPTSIGNTRCRIASLRFCKNIVNGHVRDLLLDNADVFLVGDHPHILHWADGIEAVDGELDE